MKIEYESALMMIDARDKRIASLEAVLREIAEHPHCEWGGNYNVFPCDDRDVIGHRCAAEIARKALTDRPKEE